MEFVKNKLDQWNLTEFYNNFESEGIDEEAFKLLDDDTLKILVPKAGPRLKFKEYFRNFLSNDLIQVEQDPPSMDTSLSEQSISDSFKPDEPSVSRKNVFVTVLNEKKLDLRRIVERKLPDILIKLDENHPEKLTILDKYNINRLICDTYIETYSCTPTTTEKIQLAKSIVETFPVLRSAEGDGFVSISVLIILKFLISKTC